VGFLLRNWHLKLSAVLLATVLYTGLVFSDSFAEDNIQVRVDQANVSRDAFVLSGDLGLVDVRFLATAELGSSVSEADFIARVDFSEYDMARAPEPQQLPVEVTTLRDGIEVLGVNPAEIRVEVDRVVVRSVPVEVEPGTIPDGLEIDDPVVNLSEVEVRGPESLVGRIDHAAALISIPASGIDVNEAVDLTLVDVEGQPVGTGMIEVDPETVSVQVDVRAVETQTTVAVRIDLEQGTPAPGFALEALGVTPAAVTIVGLPEDLAEIQAILTEPISIEGASSDQSFEVALELPDGISLADGETAIVTVTASIVPSVSSRTFIVGVICQGAGANSCIPRIEQLTITLSGSGEALSALTADDVTPILDASGLAPGNHTLTPAISGLPSGVELISITPGAVPLTIVAPEAVPTPTPAP
jgi:YbbR domain-containing protein